MKEIFRIVAQILVYVFVFIAALYVPKDPDLGWHLKYGEYFFQHHQILRENIYSTLMPHYHWANGSWGTDILTYGIYHTGGFLGLILVSALIVTATFFFFAKAAKFTLFEEVVFFPVMVYLESSMNNNGFRGQQISMLLLGVLIFMLSRYKPFDFAQGKFFSKTVWFVPLLFLFWSNLQTESFLGLVVFGLWVFFILLREFFVKKKSFFKESLFLGKVFLVTFLVTFINPFGFHTHQNALAHLGDPLLKKVTEYIPFVLFGKLWWNHILILSVLFFRRWLFVF